MLHPRLPIGALVKRSGVAASALRFYESQGLIKSTRNPAGRRMFTTDVLRRVAFNRVARGTAYARCYLESARICYIVCGQAT